MLRGTPLAEVPLEFSGPLHDLRANFDSLSFTLLLAAGVAAGVFALVFAWRWWASFPRLPDAGPEDLDFGPEPPALANLLVNRWQVTRSALGATLLDLCARRYLGLDQLDEEHFVVRVRDAAGAKGELAAYEKQVMDLVRNRATGGSCPVEALQLGEEDAAASWWKRFSGAVEKDARKLGLARSRWTRFDWLVMGIALAVPLGLLALSFGQAGIGSNTSQDPDKNFNRGDWLAVAGVSWLAGLLLISRLRDLRDTPAGREACARWLGVRDYFRHGHAFDHAPAASVVVWERNLSYGAALGVAHEAVSALPFAAESRNTAWSRYGGDWHEVRIHYPERFGACQRPAWVLLSGLARAIFFGGIAFVALPIIVPVLLDIIDSPSADGYLSERAALTLSLVVGGVVTIGGIFLTLRFLGGVIRVWRALGDLLGKGVVTEGEVIKVLYGRVAVFDGKHEETVAWKPSVVGQQFQRSMLLRVETTPHLHWVKHVEMLDGGAVPSSAPAQSNQAAGTRFAGLPFALPPLDSVVREATGLALIPGGGGAAATGTQAFQDSAGNSVVVNGLRTPAGVAGTLAAAFMQRSVGKANLVEGLGESAWYRDGSLLVKNGDEILMVRVELKGQSPEAELRAAQKIAEAALAAGARPGAPAAETA